MEVCRSLAAWSNEISKASSRGDSVSFVFAVCLLKVLLGHNLHSFATWTLISGA
jgi:hypothetical protein